MVERFYSSPTLMADARPQLETPKLKPPLSPDQQVANLYAEESKKPGGGNPVFKDLMWHSGLVTPFKKEAGAYDLFERLKSSGMALEHQKLLMERYIEKNNKDIYKGDQTQLDLETYYPTPDKKQEAA